MKIWACRTVDHAHGVARVVDETLIARHMVLAQHDILRRQPTPIAVAKDRVLPAVGVRRLVLLPQEQPRDAGALQLLLELGEIGRRNRCGDDGALIKPTIELLVIKPRRQWPGNAGVVSPTQAFLHRGTGAPDGLGDAPVAKTGFEAKT